MRLSGLVIRILPEDHDTHILQRRQFEGAIDVFGSRKYQMFPAFCFDKLLHRARVVVLIEVGEENRATPLASARNCQLIVTRPVSLESAPYLAALVASSCNAMPSDCEAD